jgi:hypothetical protein
MASKKKAEKVASFSFKKLDDKIDIQEINEILSNYIVANEALMSKVDDIERKLTEALKRADQLDNGFNCEVELNPFEVVTFIGLNDRGELVVTKSPTKKAKKETKDRIIPFSRLETEEIAYILDRAEVPDPSGNTASIMELIEACQNAED